MPQSPIDLPVFIALQVGQALLCAVLATANISLFRTNRAHFLSHWALAWYALGGTHLLSGVEAAYGVLSRLSARPPMLLAFLTDWLGFLAVATLVGGTYAFVKGDRRTPRSLLLVAGGSAAVAVATAIVIPSIDGGAIWRYPIRTTLAGIVAIVSAVWLWRGGPRGSHPKALAAAIGGYSLPMFAYTLVIPGGVTQHLDQLITVGLFESVLMVMMALALIVWLLDRERAATAAAIRSEQDLRKQLETRESVFRSVIDQVPDAIALLDDTGRNVAGLRDDRPFLGYSSEALIGRSMFELVHPDDRDRARAELGAVAARPGATGVAHLRFQHRDGRMLTLECIATNCQSVPSLQGILVLARDVSERRALEQRLAQAERLESIGRLAGGVAHDFNNLLTVVTGNASLLALELPLDSPHRAWVAEIEQAADRGASLTRHLLAFSRKQPVEPRVFELNGLVTGLLPIIRRLVGESVSVSWRPAGVDCHVKADPHQIEQVVINLTTNARDAMPSGGQLLIATDRDAGAVRLVVDDTGLGMSEEVRQRAFEPFFTTNPGGTGAGLGLATSYGIIHQVAGTVTLASEVGRGTTATVSLPEVAGPPSRGRALARPDDAERPGQRQSPDRRGRALGPEGGRDRVADGGIRRDRGARRDRGLRAGGGQSSL